MKIMASRMNDKYGKFKTQDFIFCMDVGHLLIQIGDNEEVLHSLTPQETHRFLNLLYCYQQDIVDANVEAKRYGIQVHKKHKDASS